VLSLLSETGLHTVEVDENTGASTSSAPSFELQALSNSQTENVLKNLLPDNDGFNDLIKVLDISQQHQNNVANRSSQSLMNQLPAPFVNNCQNITINYNIFQGDHLTFFWQSPSYSFFFLGYLKKLLFVQKTKYSMGSHNKKCSTFFLN
jgi:hypothetical protein